MSALPLLAEYPPVAMPRGIIASLGRVALPLELDRLPGETEAGPTAPLTFRFCFIEVPFEGRAHRRDGRPVLELRGELGILPFSIECARRRRRLRRVLEAAQRRSGLCWKVTGDHRILVTGEIDLNPPLTPAAVIAGAVSLILRGRPYLDLAVGVAGED